MTASPSSFPPGLRKPWGKKEKSQPERLGVIVSGLIMKHDGGDETGDGGGLQVGWMRERETWMIRAGHKQQTFCLASGGATN